MAAIVAGGCVLSWTQRVEESARDRSGSRACLCWAIDNNFTRVVSGGDPVRIAAIKGGVAGCINVAIALSLRARLPDAVKLLSASAISFAGYGVSFGDVRAGAA